MVGKSLFKRFAPFFAVFVLSTTVAEYLYAQGNSSLSRVELSSSVPLIAGEVVDLRLMLTVGERLPLGTKIMVTRHWQTDLPLQHDDPRSDNHVLIASAESTVEFAKTWEGKSGIHGGLRGTASLPVFKTLISEYSAGDSIQIIVQNLKLPEAAHADFELPIYIQRPGESDYQRVSGNSLAVNAGTLSRIAAHATSRVLPGERASLTIALGDKFNNLVAAGRLQLDLLVNGVYSGQLDQTKPVQTFELPVFEEPGIYRVQVRSGGGGLRAEANPIVVAAHDFRLSWPDLDSLYPELNTLASTGDIRLQSVPDGLSPYPTHEAENQSGVFGSSGEFVQHLSDQPVSEFLAEAELPSDIREFTPSSLKVVRIVNRDSMHLWYLKDSLDRGYDVGIIGSNHSRQFPDPALPVYNALEVAPSETWFEALKEGRSYVSVGHKVDIETVSTVLSLDQDRQLSFNLTAAVEIVAVKLYKNGLLIDQAEGEPIKNSIRIKFYSDSAPYGRYPAAPRNARQWLGYVAARDNRLDISSSKSASFKLRGTESRVDFLLSTHGRHKQMDLYTDGDTDEDVLELVLASGFEDSAWIPLDRNPSEIPAARFTIPFSLLPTGVNRTVQVAGYEDVVHVGLATEPLGTRFEYRFTDAAEAKLGDYYYLLVLLKDGGYAVSRPRIVTL